ncbi:MAG: hypothetical protein CVU57_20800 [Deltaproteobacteria bacterium HGW-Deltaproteobacteria-15]|nr:MAG: hypothetical protein CVU57_20800 [Deltaproteobacteria bacterium HGW-Deltaproteobacteria-15]
MSMIPRLSWRRFVSGQSFCEYVLNHHIFAFQLGVHCSLVAKARTTKKPGIGQLLIPGSSHPTSTSVE